MKIKIGTILDDGLIQKLKEYAVKNKKTMSDVIQEAIICYLQDDWKFKIRMHAFKRLMGKIS
jgi:metal-responsive CopG/Arc/MetJ family transcriptional regulator